MTPKLGIVAGGGELPGHLIAACRASGRDFFVLALDGQAEAATISDTPHEWVRMGALGEGLDLLRGAGVEELVLAGRVRRPSLAEIRPDLRATKMFAKLGKALLGDDALLSAVVRELEGEGFAVIAPENVLGGLLAEERSYGRGVPDDGARRDIDRGIAVAKALGTVDVGQAVVVQEGLVLGVEAIEGTDALLGRCASLHRVGPGGVLVKTRKPDQEHRLDLPTIGVATVEAAAAAGLAGIAIEAGGALVVDAEAVARAADEAGLFVIGVAV